VPSAEGAQCGLKYMHSAGVIHRDLKPSDILVSEKCTVKICDIGLPRDQFPHVEGYAPTRYRAPEFTPNGPNLRAAIDIWSAGCIFAEMLDGKPLFPNSRDNRYSNITELRGTPSEEVIQSLGKKNARCVRSLPRSEKVPLENKFPAADSSGKGPNETCTDQSRSVVGNDVGN
jgi:p38 MAP kinase